LKGELFYGGFKLLDDGSKFITPQQQLNLLDEVEKNPEEKLTVYVLFYWDNLRPVDFKKLMDKTFELDYITIYRDIKSNVIFKFREKEVSLRYRQGWSWTWPELVELIKKQLARDLVHLIMA